MCKSKGSNDGDLVKKNDDLILNDSDDSNADEDISFVGEDWTPMTLMEMQSDCGDDDEDYMETDLESDETSGEYEDMVTDEESFEAEDATASTSAPAGEDEEEDDLIKAIRHEKEKPREHPPDIVFKDFVFDICFHPQEELIAAANITGDIILYKYTNDSTEISTTVEVHTKPCRDIRFSDDGKDLFSCSTDKSIVVTDMSTGKMKRFYDDAHEAAVYSLLVVEENLLASGDEGGTVKLWDVRMPEAIYSSKKMMDYVSCMLTNDRRQYLVCSSGDGSITAIDLATRQLKAQSEMYSSELFHMALMRKESKLVVGAGDGRLYIYNWGEFGLHNDSVPTCRGDINRLVPITENIVVSACGDGQLRATNLFPHRQLGIVGQHQFDVHLLDISGDGSLLASCAHDFTIKFWNIGYFEDIQVNPREKSCKEDKTHNLPSSKCKNSSDFFADM